MPSAVINQTKTLQIRQRTGHKRTMMLLEQRILQADAHRKCFNVVVRTHVGWVMRAKMDDNVFLVVNVIWCVCLLLFGLCLMSCGLANGPTALQYKVCGFVVCFHQLIVLLCVRVFQRGGGRAGGFVICFRQ